MNRQLISAFSLSSLLLACAHNRSNDGVAEADARDARASAETREERQEARADRAEERGERAEDRAESRAENGRQRAEDRADGVEVPARRQKRGEMASAGDEIPTNKQPDNTGVNERDADGKNLTAMDQGNSEIDIDMTQRIRKAVMDADLSFTARNIKIITRDGHVVLRGPVNTAAEKDAIFKLATSNAGAGHVTNQLEVKGD